MKKRDDLPLDAVPRPLRSRIDGYELKRDSVGWEIRLTFAFGNEPSMITMGPWWALTEAGAHRKAVRLVARRRRQDERDEDVRRFDA